jgi:dTDP-4-amino-4,6-dideoxygalactose transaminase
MRDPARMSRASEGAWYYEQQELGFNFRMTDIQAALGLSQLGRLDELRARREQLASRYDDRLRELSLILPPRSGDRASSWHLYVVEIGDVAKRASRADVFARLRSKGIGVNVHYIPIHTQPYYARKGFRQGDFPACERYYERALSIPLFPAMTDSQQDYVVDQLAEALG